MLDIILRFYCIFWNQDLPTIQLVQCFAYGLDGVTLFSNFATNVTAVA